MYDFKKAEIASKTAQRINGLELVHILAGTYDFAFAKCDICGNTFYSNKDYWAIHFLSPSGAYAGQDSLFVCSKKCMDFAVLREI